MHYSIEFLLLKVQFLMFFFVVKGEGSSPELTTDPTSSQSEQCQEPRVTLVEEGTIKCEVVTLGAMHCMWVVEFLIL